MSKMVVRPSRLEGSVEVSGAKNSALKLLSASILSAGDLTIENFPAMLTDVAIHVDMLRAIGKICEVGPSRIRIMEGAGLVDQLYWEGRSIRSSLLILGALLGRNGRGAVPRPGGCVIGDRKYDLHLMVLRSLGADVWEDDRYIYGEAPRGLIGADIHLPLRSTGATENAILAATRAAGTTVVWNPHVRPEVLDMIAMLQKMGASIEVRGQESIVVRGVNQLTSAAHTVIPDNVEALSYMIAAVVTRGDVEIIGFPFDHLEVPLIHLRESGAAFYRCGDRVIVRGGTPYPIEAATGPFPGINSDMQPMLAVYGLCATGETRIIDLRFPDRFGYVDELRKLGANVEVHGNIVHVRGGEQLTGAKVYARDLRCGAALLIAGLVAEGETEIDNAREISRGYEDVERKLKGLGSDVRFIEQSVFEHDAELAGA